MKAPLWAMNEAKIPPLSEWGMYSVRQPMRIFAWRNDTGAELQVPMPDDDTTPCAPGEWLVHGVTGYIRVLTQAQFDRMYGPVSEDK